MKQIEITHENAHQEENESYIILAMKQNAKNGDTYISYVDLYEKCLRKNPQLTPEEFSADLDVLLSERRVIVEDDWLYLANIWHSEQTAAHCLAHILTADNNSLPVLLPPRVMPDANALCAEQVAAVTMALQHRVSLILGGAGSGKSTIIPAICSCSHLRSQEMVLCAPTGKAARIMSQKSGRDAHTVHTALGIHSDEDFCQSVSWPNIRLVIVDECSLLTLPMLAAILDRVPANCHVVMIGDHQQLPGVGAGNIIPDLLRLGVPHIFLTENHRQDRNAEALSYNAIHFADLHRITDLKTDSSFSIEDLTEQETLDRIVSEAVSRYRAGESVQVLTPFSESAGSILSTKHLNLRIRDAVNPLNTHKAFLLYKKMMFITGDRVMITQNDREKGVCNGDIGILHIVSNEKDNADFYIEMPDGRMPRWSGFEVMPALSQLMLAFALTVHKAQGSEFDCVMIALTMGMQGMLHRNLLYTAITRARKQVLIIGNALAVDISMQRNAAKRKSMLVKKTMLHIKGTA